MLKQAVERYPDYAPAHSMLAFALLVSGHAGWALSEFEPNVKQAATRAARATELDDGLRVIREGLKPEDRVIVDGLQRARVGAKVAPHAAPAAPAGGKT